MTNEYRVFGPPGTGKTRFLTEQVREWGAEFGNDKLFVASFTRAAATEIAGRAAGLREHQVGTLHSHAFRALGLGRDDVAESHLEDFNEHHPGWTVRTDDDRMDDSFYKDHLGEGDDALAATQRLRARRVPVDQWPRREQSFYKVWSEWCDELGVTDFTGMIERALEEVPHAPGDPRIGLFDEAQDFTPLELALVRKWGASMERILLAGDDDQTIYGFKGAVPDVFLDPPLPDDRVRVLAQSYRVPVAVHAFADEWVKQIKRRQPKEYFPRAEDGEPVMGKVRFLTPFTVRMLIERMKEDEAAGKTVMLLAPCRFSLWPAMREMKEQGVPFHNPYAKDNGQWNPLAAGGRTRRRAVDKVLAFLRPNPEVWGDAARMWSYGELAAFLDGVKAQGFLARGAKTWLNDQAPGTVADANELAAHVWLNEVSDEVSALENGDMQMLLKLTLASKRPPLEFPVRVAEARGGATLQEPPKITVGTIHSVKGGQADVVYLLPEMSKPGHDQWNGSPERHDEVVRLFYVGATRAREELVICEGGNKANHKFVGMGHSAAINTTKGSK